MRRWLRTVVIRMLVRLLDKTAAVTGSLGHNDEVAYVRVVWNNADVSDTPIAALEITAAGRVFDVILSPAQLQLLSWAVITADEALRESFGYAECPDFDVRYARTVR